MFVGRFSLRTSNDGMSNIIARFDLRAVYDAERSATTTHKSLLGPVVNDLFGRMWRNRHKHTVGFHFDPSMSKNATIDGTAFQFKPRVAMRACHKEGVL